MVILEVRESKLTVIIENLMYFLDSRKKSLYHSNLLQQNAQEN